MISLVFNEMRIILSTLISNQAQLSFAYDETTGTAVSNIATITMLDPLGVSKSALGPEYRLEEELTYIFTLENNSTSPLTGIQVLDDLGSYLVGGLLLVTPLTYVGPTYLYIDGEYSSELTPVVTAHSVSFAVASLAAGETATIVYKALVNEFAPGAPGSTIENTAAITAVSMTGSLEASAIVTVESYVDVQIVKSMYPDPVTEGELLTYHFDIYNYGNTAATDVVLTDTFSPAPAAISISVDGVPIDPTQFDYLAGVLTLPNALATLSITIPAADFVQDPVTGVYTVNPGIVSITVSGAV